jgi:hypothetical protein
MLGAGGAIMRMTKSWWIVCCCAWGLLGCYSSQGRGDDDHAHGDATVVDADPSAWLEVVGEVGDTGWGDSVAPWQPPVASDSRLYCLHGGVWSEPGAVFATIGWVFDADRTYPRAFDIQVNRGEGWRSFFAADCAALLDGPTSGISCPEQLTGRLEDALLVWPPLVRIRADGFAHEDVGADDLFVVRNDLAYALQGGGSQPVIRYDGGSWGPVPAVFPAGPSLTDIWANEETVAVVGDSGTLRTLTGTEWRQWNTGTLARLYLVWGFDDGEIWVTGDHELRRCRDESCEPLEWPDLGGDDVCAGGGIQFFWGADGVLFFATEHELVRWDGTAFTVLGYWPATYVPDPTEADCRGGGLWIKGLWGNSPTEVFLAVDGFGPHSGNCSGYHLLRWDGAAFHWF